jgi:Uma2 family endonuclease
MTFWCSTGRSRGSDTVTSFWRLIAVSRRKPQRYFEADQPPDLVIEVLSTHRSNVERTEKLDDFAP